MHIGVDLMGSDSSPKALFEAIIKATTVFPDINLVVFITSSLFDQFHSEFQDNSIFNSARVKFEFVTSVIEREDDPLGAIRKKQNSSIVTGLKFLKKGSIDGFVSVGNTGALIAGAALYLTLSPGIKRPALLATLPTARGNVAMIDVGGNVSYKAGHLVQFAKLAVAYQKCCHGIESPRVGLLNIGVESKKGTSEVRKAYQLLQEMNQKGELVFEGNVEGKDVFSGNVDVLVTDGFSGNILLKTAEGLSRFILQKVRLLLGESVPEKVSEVMSQLDQFSDDRYNGAIICGVGNVVIKCHGKSSTQGFFNGIQRAIELIESNFVKN